MWYLLTTQDINGQLHPNQLLKNGITLLPGLLKDDDLSVLHNYISKGEIQHIKQFIMDSTESLPTIQSILGKEYTFQDYLFFIKKSQFHTCHRDYNGDFFNVTQQFPSYTLILYLEDMDKCLDVIPGSHLSQSDYNWNMTDYTQTVLCKKGDALLFNANLVHGGSLNEKENNQRIQMKISHIEDMDVLHFYNEYNKVLNVENNTPMFLKQLQKNVSCQFPAMSDYLKKYDGNNENTNTQTDTWFSSLFTPLESIPVRSEH
jgi:ectoine hydroxylase-related dioxygenase (phytanoyl-CoA dioxygenase family)